MSKQECRKYFFQLKSDLETIYSDSESQNIANLVFKEIWNKPLSVIFSTDDETDAYKQNITLAERYKKRLLNHEPIQYILNKSYFLDLELRLDNKVLIPRPETEDLVLMILEHLKSASLNHINILDIGTGSGCIAISLKKYLPSSNVFACDISADAICVAEQNAINHGCNDIAFHLIDILKGDEENIYQDSFFDIIVSNPPYICKERKENMDKKVVQYEPHMALFTGDDSWEFYSSILQFGKHKGKSACTYFFEIDDLSTKPLETIFEKKKLAYRFHKDRFGKIRLATLQ